MDCVEKLEWSIGKWDSVVLNVTSFKLAPISIWIDSLKDDVIRFE